MLKKELSEGKNEKRESHGQRTAFGRNRSGTEKEESAGKRISSHPRSMKMDRNCSILRNILITWLRRGVLMMSIM